MTYFHRNFEKFFQPVLLKIEKFSKIFHENFICVFSV